jgi:N-acetylglutamate synthase-like GNAT family acetyltransferase
MVAAVWVEEEARRLGIGAALVERAVQDCFALEIGRAYLCARPHLLAFYTGLGWTAVETDLGPHHLTVFIRDAARQPSELNSSP